MQLNPNIHSNDHLLYFDCHNKDDSDDEVPELVEAAAGADEEEVRP